MTYLQVEIKRAEPRTNVTELTPNNGPVVDQWGAAAAAPHNGIHHPPNTPTYSGWGAPTAGPSPVTQNFATATPQPAGIFSLQTSANHWGSPPASQPSAGLSWGAPPPPITYQQQTIAAASQPIHYISPAPPNPTPPQPFTTSYWGSPPGPTPPPSATPQEMYSPHAAAASPQSPAQPPKFDMSAAAVPGFHLHPAPPPPHEYARAAMYQKPQPAAAPTQFTTATHPEFYSRPAAAAVQVATFEQQPRLGGMTTAYATAAPGQPLGYAAATYRRT